MDQEETGENLQAAAEEQVLENEAIEDQVQETLQEQPRMVPLDALEDERRKRQEHEEQLRLLRDHVALMQANQQRPAETKKDDWADLQEDDVLTVKEAKRALSQIDSKYQTSLKELQMAQKHPDYNEVITQYLPEVIKKNPSLRRTIEQTQDYDLAYHLAKNSDAYREKNRAVKKNSDAQRILQNTQKTAALSSAGQTSPISKAKNYKAMNDAEFAALMQRNMGYF